VVIVYVLALSVFLQFLTVVFSLRLISVTRAMSAWVLISMSILTMGIRRFMSLYGLVSGPGVSLADLSYELVGLLGSAFMLGGVLYISPLFLSIKKQAASLRYRFEMERIISRISSDFINMPPDKVNQGIDRALSEIGVFTSIDRAYLFLLSEDGASADNTHEWCSPGTAAQIGHLQGVPMSSLPWFNKQIRAMQSIIIPRVADLPAEASEEYSHFMRQDIRSLIVVPMEYQGALKGFIGFDSVLSEKAWIAEDAGILSMLGQVFINAIEHRKIVEERESLIEELTSANSKVKVLSGFLPICAWCKKIRDDKGYWNQLEGYIRTHSEAEFSHGICPDCAKKVYPEHYDK